MEVDYRKLVMDLLDKVKDDKIIHRVWLILSRAYTKQ